MNVLGISGSLRKGSFNTATLRAAQAAAPAGMKIEIGEIADLPVYNGDLDNDQSRPQSVKTFVAKIAAADAVLIATPEYNYSIPGGLKNAIDWASRGKPQPFQGKPVAILGASMGVLGTARAQYHLRQVFVFLDAHVLNKPEIFIGKAQDKFDGEGKLTDEATRQLIGAQLEALAGWTRRLKG